MVLIGKRNCFSELTSPIITAIEKYQIYGETFINILENASQQVLRVAFNESTN